MEFNNLGNLNKNRYYRNFCRDNALIFTVIFIVFVWALMYLLIFYKPEYKSSAKIWIKDLTTDEFVTNLDTQGQLTPLTSAGNPLLTQIEILKSNQLRDFVNNYRIKKFDNKNKSIDIDSLLDVKNKPGTDILNITFSSNEPKDAQETLTEVLKEYDNINLLINRKIKTARREYIDLKLAEINKKLYDVRNKIKEYKSSNLAISIDEESTKLVGQKIDTASKLEDVLADINRTQSSIIDLENQLSLKSHEALNAVALGSDNITLMKLRDDLNTAVQQYQYDYPKFADTNPKMIAQKNKISEINKQIKDQIKLSIGKYAKNQGINIFDPVRQKLAENLVTAQTELISLQAEKVSVDESIEKIKAEQAKIPEKKFTLDNLEQEERTLSNASDELAKKQIEARIKEAEAVSNVVIVDPPSYPKSISFPNPVQVLILALMLGAFAGITVSVLKTLIEDICDDIESIEEITGTSIIGTIPWVENFVDNDQIQFIHGIAYNNIVSNLMIKCYKNNNKVLTFTSSSLKKPQSTIIYYLACRLRKLGHSVVVIDSDFRIPTVIKNAEVEDKVKTNLSDLIVSLENKIRKTKELEANEVLNVLVEDNKGIKHLGNKDIVFEPYEFFGTSAFESIVNLLKENFDWVLIDTGAAHITPEFLIISRLSDGVILFVNKTITYTIIKNIAKSLKNANIPIIGTIVREPGARLEKEYEKYLRHQEDQILQEAELQIPG
jgi:uncharacterized protein involved in exopolysaccharide biosynthesis